jgi:hypothetical protein
MPTQDLKLNQHGIEVFKGLFAEEELKHVQRNVNLQKLAAGYKLKNDANRAAWAESLFSRIVIEMIVEKNQAAYPR